jgi:hypothetical protein
MNHPGLSGDSTSWEGWSHVSFEEFQRRCAGARFDRRLRCSHSPRQFGLSQFECASDS